MGHRKILGIVVPGVLLLVAAGWAAAWWFAAAAVERGIHAWIEDQRAMGNVVELRALTMGGFPLSIRATAEEATVGLQGVEWSGGTIVAEAPVWAPKRIALTLPGEQHLRVSPAGSVPVALTARGGGTGRVTIGDAGRPLEAVIALSDVTATPALVGVAPATIAALDVTLSQPAEPPASSHETGLAIVLGARDVRLPPGAHNPFGAPVETAYATLRVQGRPPAPEPDSLSAWSREGGTVEVDSLDVAWGPLKLALNGTLALDRDLQPQAAMTARVRGAQEALTALQGHFRPNELNMARAVVGMLARPDESGEPVVTAPVTIQSRAVFLGPLKVAAVPLIRW